MFSDEEVTDAINRTKGLPYSLHSSTVRRIMERTAELLAARGGALTAEVELALTSVEHNYSRIHAASLRKAFATRGVRVAALEEQLSASQEAVRELTRRAQQAESERDMWRKRVERAAEELASVGAGEFGRLDIVSRIRHLKARCATLSAAGQVLSEHVGKDACWCYDGDNSQGPAHTEACERVRYPCSPTCTHDDAAKPGHQERVKERSEAVIATLRDSRPETEESREVIESEAESHAYERGAEAMRAACCEAVQRECQKYGLREYVAQSFKAAIEGSTP
jgi:TolA-binding protein